MNLLNLAMLDWWNPENDLILQITTEGPFA